ncbi:MAG: DNA polymerase ligase N-terminal domain-containing protein, partial [Planctomycetota bacterium]
MAAKKQAGKTKAQLEAYRQKRNFDRTPEPKGDAPAASESGRLYVVQKHDARNLHYDIRLEFDGALKSWAVPKGPSLDPSQKPLAVEVEEHPIEYGSLEGIIPKGEYGGGTVMLWDQGEWEPIGDPVEGYQRGDLKFRLHGEKLRGDWVLVRMSGKTAEDGRNWLLIKKRDAEARSVRSFNVQAELPHSVLSGRSLDEITREPEAVWKDGQAQPTESAKGKKRPSKAAKPQAGAARQAVPDASARSGARKGRQPQTLKPQLCTSVREAPAGDGWLHEIKLDGYRLIASIHKGDVHLFTRNGHDWTQRFKNVAAALARLPIESAILDGEVVVLNSEGISDFGALQNAFRGYTAANFVYYLFDAPYAQGYDLRQVPLLERKQLLEAWLRAAPLAAPTLQYCDHILGKGPVVFEQAARSGLEGIISKRVDAPYESRRTD